MGTADQIQVVLVQEFGHHLGTKGKRHTPVILPPAQNILVWVRPEQITQETLVGNVSGTHDTSDLLHGLKVRRQSWKKNNGKSTSKHTDTDVKLTAGADGKGSVY